jgi:YidC/Oxa1 family membrane protein insertase
MADSVTAANRAFALSFGGPGNPIVNDLFKVQQNGSPDGEQEIIFSRDYALPGSSGSSKVFTLSKRYTFHPDDYLFKLDVIVNVPDGSGLNFGSGAYTLRTSPQIGPHWDKKKDKYERRTFMAWNGTKKKTDSVKNGAQKTHKEAVAWTGVTGKYFDAILVPPNAADFQPPTYSMTEVNAYPNSQVLLPRNAIAEKGAADTFYVYLGPVTEGTLKIYNNAGDNSWGLAGLRLNESIQSTGILAPVEAIFKWCLEQLYKLIPNWGIGIIILTILIKIILFPLTKKSSVASKKMQVVQPQMAAIQAKYKGSPEKLNAELAKVYKEAGANPMSGCLPLLIQFPIIIAMFNLFNNYFEFRGAMFIPGWIPDLSVGDSLMTFNFTVPFLGWTDLRLLPVIYVISQLLFGKLTPSAPGGSNMQMKMMMYGMPLFFFFIFYNAPSGLLLYWTTSNILQLFQQLIINKTLAASPAGAKSGVPQVFKPKKRK